MEYEETKNEGEKDQEEEGAETPKEPEVKMEEKAKPKAPPIQPYEPPVPYPQRVKKKEYDQHAFGGMSSSDAKVCKVLKRANF